MATLPPGPRGERLGRHNYAFWQADMFGFLAGLAERHGDVVGFDLGRSPSILVNGAAPARELLFERESSLRKPELVKDSNRGYWGDGLTTLEGAAWHARRRLVRPSFATGPVSGRLPVVARCTEDMLDGWALLAEVDLLEQLRILTARIAARVVLDAELAGYGSSDGRSGALPLSEAYGEDYTSCVVGDPTAPLVMVRPRAPRRMDTVLHIIDARLAGGEPRGDVLSDLIHAAGDDAKLTREEIVGEVIQMLYAGHLTIPSSLVHFWRDLAASDAAPVVAAEGDRLCASGAPESAALLGSYCLAGLKESMRLHPAAPILYREVESPFELGGFGFARDVAVWVSPQLLHNDARYFPEPQRFLPERFTRQRVAVAPDALYLPFGAGPRACVASHQALLQLTLIGLLTARRYHLTPIAGSSKASVRARAGNRVGSGEIVS